MSSSTPQISSLVKFYVPNDKFEEKWSKQPFEYISRVNLLEFCKRVPDQDDDTLYPGDFPNNIEHVYYYRNGCCDGEDWILVCSLYNGVYLLFKAGCDSRGFENQGRYELVLSDNMENLYTHGFTDEVKKLYNRYQEIESIPKISSLTKYYVEKSEFDEKWCKEPFGYLSEYGLKNCSRTIPVISELSPGNFPNNIEHVYYYRNGYHDGDVWILVCSLTNDVCVFFRAWCDYTGFDCQGGIELVLADNMENLYEYGFTNEVRKLYNSYQEIDN